MLRALKTGGLSAYENVAGKLAKRLLPKPIGDATSDNPVVLSRELAVSLIAELVRILGLLDEFTHDGYSARNAVAWALGAFASTHVADDVLAAQVPTLSEYLAREARLDADEGRVLNAPQGAYQTLQYFMEAHVAEKALGAQIPRYVELLRQEDNTRHSSSGALMRAVLGELAAHRVDPEGLTVALPPLLEDLRHPNPFVRREAQETLSGFAKGRVAIQDLAAAIAPIMDDIKSGEAALSGAAGKFLEAFAKNGGTPDALADHAFPLIRERLEHRNGLECQVAADLITVFAEHNIANDRLHTTIRPLIATLQNRREPASDAARSALIAIARARVAPTQLVEAIPVFKALTTREDIRLSDSVGGLMPTTLTSYEYLRRNARWVLNAINETRGPETAATTEGMEERPRAAMITEVLQHADPATINALMELQAKGATEVVLVPRKAVDVGMLWCNLVADASLTQEIRTRWSSRIELESLDGSDFLARTQYLQAIAAEAARELNMRTVFVLDATRPRVALPNPHPLVLLLNPATLDHVNRAAIFVLLSHPDRLRGRTIDLSQGPLGTITLDDRTYDLYA